MMRASPFAQPRRPITLLESELYSAPKTRTFVPTSPWPFFIEERQTDSPERPNANPQARPMQKPAFNLIK
jgi:hypothetical protein